MEFSRSLFSSFANFVKLLIPGRAESVSRDYWMPDHSCLVCYDCDIKFTIFNRRHHCRLCGRVFCGKCTTHSVPVSSDNLNLQREEGERIRVCNFCFKQWEHDMLVAKNTIQKYGSGLSRSVSTQSIESTKSSGTLDSSSVTPCSIRFSAGQHPHGSYSSGRSIAQPVQMGPCLDMHDKMGSEQNSIVEAGDTSPSEFGICRNRGCNDEDGYGGCNSNSETPRPQSDCYYNQVEFDESDPNYQSNKMLVTEEYMDEGDVCSPADDDTEFCTSLGTDKMAEDAGTDNSYDGDTTSSMYGMETTDAEPVDFENNGLLWLPPEPEDEEDEREPGLFDDDDDYGTTGEWGYLRSSNSFGSSESRSKDRSCEEHKKAMKNVVDGHFRALIAQLLQVENLPMGEEDDTENWLEIITSLSWEAATLLKPDTSKGGGMDPGGYVKVKCLACGHRSQSMVVQGIVCKKNVAHRRMASRIEKPRFLMLGGALEYQRVSNLLSSIQTLRQQEMDHLKMAVAKIHAYNPSVLLVEKSVSRFAQEFLLERNISLVLNIKRPLLERIARCSGSQIVSSVDHLSSQNLGLCDFFHVEKFFEEHGSAGQGGKKLSKTLMFFEGCPKPLGCTILLKGANGDELKKVKHVVQYGVFAAYHLAVETSFLADEGASLPELPLKSPLTVSLPDKPSTNDRYISKVPDFIVPVVSEPHVSSDVQIPKMSDLTTTVINLGNLGMTTSPIPYGNCKPQSAESASTISRSIDTKLFLSDITGHPEHATEQQSKALSSPTNSSVFSSYITGYPSSPSMKERNKVCFGECQESETLKKDCQGVAYCSMDLLGSLHNPETTETVGSMAIDIQVDSKHLIGEQPGSHDVTASNGDNDEKHDDQTIPKDEFPPSDHQSILVSLSTRCVWKGVVCERSHLFRIKYYGNLDKPLGRFLRDHLFDQSYNCRSCDMPSEAHVHSYTHRQGSLTISVRKLPEFLLPGERDGKIWMWHRCLRCPRNIGLPPATRRIVMSDAAWGLSFGKFLELSFSNHAAASRVASCGHSLHRDCLRFYGLGKMVACFRYASIDLHSVYLPPSKLDFNCQHQEWIEKEGDEVADWAELLFTEVQDALHQISERRSSSGSSNGNTSAPELRYEISQLEEILQKEKVEFKVSMQKVLRKGQPVVDILEVNRLRRQLLFHSYLWDQRLIFAAGSASTPHEVLNSFLTREKENMCSTEKLAELNLLPKTERNFTSSNAMLSDSISDVYLGSIHVLNPQEQLHGRPNNLDAGQHTRDIELDLFQGKQSRTCLATSISATDQLVSKETGLVSRRALSDGEFPIMANLSKAFDAKWTGDSNPLLADASVLDSSAAADAPLVVSASEELEERSGVEVAQTFASSWLMKLGDGAEDLSSWIGMPFLNFYRSFNKNWNNIPKFDSLSEYSPIYISLFRKLERPGGARLLLPICLNDTVIPIYDDEPTSIISYALATPYYHIQLSDERERLKEGGDFSTSLPSYESGNFHLSQSVDDMSSEPFQSFGSTEDSILSLSGNRSSLVLDPLIYTKAMHVRVSFADESSLGKVKYTVTCYYAKHFDALRRTCCPSEFDFVRSLSRCKKWGAQGGKSNVFFAKSLDDRFIVKQVTKTELESFIKFAPGYFNYLAESIGTRSPTCLAKILGIYQVTSKHLKGGKESRMDVLVMENLLFGQNVTRLYDLKGSSRSRYNPDSSGNNKVLLDQNLIEALPTSPIFVGKKAKRLLERAVWNDTNFLASIDVMDYSLLVGVDEKKHELVLGIIDFMRQYTWDKHLETWVKTAGILGGSKNTSPTVISPKQYKKRFRKAMSAYFLVVPDQWSFPAIVPSKLQSEPCEDNELDAPFGSNM